MLGIELLDFGAKSRRTEPKLRRGFIKSHRLALAFRVCWLDRLAISAADSRLDDVCSFISPSINARPTARVGDILTMPKAFPSLVRASENRNSREFYEASRRIRRLVIFFQRLRNGIARAIDEANISPEIRSNISPKKVKADPDVIFEPSQHHLSVGLMPTDRRDRPEEVS
jgi:hypothetical protein